jgi:hypothetical protein
VKQLVTVKELKHSPHDLKKFVDPQQAAKVLRILMNAIEKARPDSRWHFSLKIRCAVPKE